ncbi:MAG: hypothetical protein L3K26_10275 [Candidatus Hydrogenedentes bacterium]|nr:hypothetical protein [Candidatus Hydrogenedentota bacterium]
MTRWKTRSGCHGQALWGLPVKKHGHCQECSLSVENYFPGTGKGYRPLSVAPEAVCEYVQFVHAHEPSFHGIVRHVRDTWIFPIPAMSNFMAHQHTGRAARSGTESDAGATGTVRAPGPTRFPLAVLPIRQKAIPIMPLPPTNDPDIALAQEWLGELDAWLETHGTTGPDPFDIKAHPAMRALQDKPFRRRASTVLCDLAPHLSRRLLHIAPTENPKTHALLAIGRLRLFQLTSDAAYRDAATGHLQWLLDHACDGYSGLCWGYPFAVKAQGLDVPSNTPVCVVSAIAGEAFLLADEVFGATEGGDTEVPTPPSFPRTRESRTRQEPPKATLDPRVRGNDVLLSHPRDEPLGMGNSRYRDAAISIATHFLNDIPVFTPTETTCCFAYGPDDLRHVHNANLLVAQHLLDVAVLTNDETMARTAIRSVQFTLDAQRPDGAFPYGHGAPGDPYETGLLQMVDHHHTGFVLRSLSAINRHAENPVIEKAIRQGYRYYKTALCENNGMPRTEHGRYPVNIHACAESILCPATLTHDILGAKKQAVLGLRWSWSHMRDPKTGAPYFRKYKGLTSTITHPRWGVAWMYRALAEYLWRLGEH